VYGRAPLETKDGHPSSQGLLFSDSSECRDQAASNIQPVWRKNFSASLEGGRQTSLPLRVLGERYPGLPDREGDVGRLATGIDVSRHKPESLSWNSATNVGVPDFIFVLFGFKHRNRTFFASYFAFSDAALGWSGGKSDRMLLTDATSPSG
jgi:hypothetical protein